MTGGKKARIKTIEHNAIDALNDLKNKNKKKARKNPCSAGPGIVEPADLTFVDDKHRVHRFTAHALWDEVTLDADGFDLSAKIRTYHIQWQRSRDEGVTVDTDFDTQHESVAAKDQDENTTVHKAWRVHHGSWHYRYRIRAEDKHDRRSEWSEWTDWVSPLEEPPNPTDVTIARASHAVRVSWDAPEDDDIADVYDRRIAYFVVELFETDDPDVRDYGTLTHRAKHIHNTHHRFHIDTTGDDKTWYYARVRSVSGEDVKGERIPATKSGNDDPGHDPPSIVRPYFHRSTWDFTITGALEEGIHVAPKPVEDDYKVRRVHVAFHKPGSGGHTHIDVKVNGGTWVFDDDDTHDVSVAGGDHGASSSDVQHARLERGDHLRVDVRSVPGTPPEHAVVTVVADRYTPPDDDEEEESVGDSGGGGGE